MTVAGWFDWTIADVVLLVAVTAQGVAVAVVQQPEHKARLLMLPVPFSLAMLSVARPIDVANVLAIPALFGYALMVWLLHERLRVPILVAITVAAACYGFAGAAIARSGPTGGTAFWTAAAVTMLVGAVLVRRLPNHLGRPYRTPLPVWIKTPAVAAVVAGLIETKHVLGGFTPMFPMVSVVASYEARHSLWMIVNRIAWILVLMPPMMAAIRLLQPHVGMPLAVLLSWPVFLASLWLWHRGAVAKTPATRH